LLLTEPLIVCQQCGGPSVRWQTAASGWRCDACHAKYEGHHRAYIDLGGRAQEHTARHYSLQWSAKLGFLEFIKKQAAARAVMPAGQLGWDALVDAIRQQARHSPVSVYDAACGFGGIANDLITPDTIGHLRYVGADVHDSLPNILEHVPLAAECALFVRWDIARPLPVEGGFDYVICRAAIHHTPNPPETFRALVSKLNPGGSIAISAYRRKGPCREALDDTLRRKVSGMSADDAFAASSQFTVLGKALLQVSEPVVIPEDLPLLGIPRGSYPVQSLIYYHFLKCFYNPVFGDTYSTLVNYDWYHPEFAFRYDIEELREWFTSCHLQIDEEQSIEVQHFLKGRRVS
jgi:SAM-dependent methyltransferase